MATPAEKVLAAYREKHGKDPTKPNQLILFAKKSKDLPKLSFLEARGIMGKPKDAAKAARKMSGAKRPETYSVGDSILITKDRSGIIRFIGKVHWGGDEDWYGLEMLGGTLGRTDGTVDKKKYFECEPNRGMFVPFEKIRRKLTKRDHKRQDSYNAIAANVSDMRDKLKRGSEEDVDTAEQFKPRMESVDEDREALEKILARNQTEPQYQPGVDDDSKAREDQQTPVRGPPVSAGAPLDIDAGFLPADSYESVLLFIMKQKGSFRELLLDIYAQPSLNPLITAAFESLKEMKEADQRSTWPALIIRWRRHLV